MDCQEWRELIEQRRAVEKLSQHHSHALNCVECLFWLYERELTLPDFVSIQTSETCKVNNARRRVAPDRGS